MKKILTTAALAAVLALSSQGLFARGMGDRGCGDGDRCMGPGMGMNHLAMMEEYLNLTDEQADKIHKIDMEFRDKQYKSMKEHRKAIEAVLTDEQKKKMDDMWKNGPGKDRGDGDRRHDRKGKHNRDDRPMMMHKLLDLTDDQVDKIHKINMEYADRFHKNRKNPDEIKKLQKSRIKDIEKVLTKEQMKKLEELREDKDGMRDCPLFE